MLKNLKIHYLRPKDPKRNDVILLKSYLSRIYSFYNTIDFKKNDGY